MATEDEIASALGKQGVTNIRKISIRKWIQTNTYIQTFYQPHTPKEVKIGYCLERVEQYVPAPLRCFKCQKYGHHREPVDDDKHLPNAVKRAQTIWKKIAWKKLNVQITDKIIWFTQDLVRFTKKKRKYLRGNIKRNVSFLEVRKIVGTYMRENSYASVAQREDITNQDNKYRTLEEKLIQLEANDSARFQEHPRKLHLAEFYQAPAQKQVRNGERSNIVVQTKTHVRSTTSTRITPKSSKSPTKQTLH